MGSRWRGRQGPSEDKPDWNDAGVQQWTLRWNKKVTRGHWSIGWYVEWFYEEKMSFHRLRKQAVIRHPKLGVITTTLTSCSPYPQKVENKDWKKIHEACVKEVHRGTPSSHLCAFAQGLSHKQSGTAVWESGKKKIPSISFHWKWTQLLYSYMPSKNLKWLCHLKRMEGVSAL